MRTRNLVNPSHSRPKAKRPIVYFLLFVILVSLSSLACALLAPPTLVIPTPIPSPPPLDQQAPQIQEEGAEPNLVEVIQDPVSNIVPDIDPNIATLVDAVSEQQLIAYVQRLEDFGTRNAFSTVEETDFGIGAARRWIQAEFNRVGASSNGRLSVSNEPFLLSYLDLEAEQENIIATLAGSEPSNDVIVIMAHYDSRPNSVIDGTSISPGANDNGSGVALLLETARVLSAGQWNQTIIFAALSAEEQGTFGAKALVQQLISEGYNVIAAINYDTVGGRTDIPRSIRLFAPDIEQSKHGELARYYAYIGNLYVPTFPVNLVNALDREGRFGDQREFINQDMPGIRLTESIEESELVNSPNDRWNTIDYSYLSTVTRLNVSVVANMAGSPPKPPPPTIISTAVSGSYLLNWPQDNRAAGYAISFRPISSFTYPPFRFVNTNQAGNIVLTGFDPNETYMVSMATIDQNGRVSLFSREVRIDPGG